MTFKQAVLINPGRVSADALVELLAATGRETRLAAYNELQARGKSSVDALLHGLMNSKAKVRAACALLLDHVADARCAEPLMFAIRNDTNEAVRRCALHSLICDRCKESPLCTDAGQVLLETAAGDRSLAVRRRAAFYLQQLAPNRRIASELHALESMCADPVLNSRIRAAIAIHCG